MSHDGARSRNLADAARMARFLWIYVRPHGRLFVTTVALTILLASISGSRAFLGAGLAKVIPEMGQSVGSKSGNRVKRSFERFVERLLDPDAPVEPTSTVPREGEPAVGPGAEPATPGPSPERFERLWRVTMRLGLLALGIAICLGPVTYLKEQVEQSFVMRVMLSIQEGVTRHVLSLSLRFFHAQRLGELYSRLTNDVGQAQQALNFLFGDIFEDLFKVVIGLTVCVLASWRLSIAALVAGPLIMFILSRFGKKIRRRARSRQGAAAGVTESMQQMFSGIRTVKAYDAETHEIERFHARNEQLLKNTLKVIRTKSGSKGLLESLNNAVVAAVLLGGMALVYRRVLSLPELGAFVTSLVLMYEPTRGLTKSWNALQESLAGLDRLEELLEQKSDLPDAPDAVELSDVRGEVVVRGVSFSYGTEAVLRDVTIEARPGEVVALVGPSGGGKSTLLDLIARFYDPDAGSIEVDGHDLRKVRRSSLSRSLAIVTQEPFLFNDTVLENVRYGRRSASMEEVVSASKTANIHDVIAALPMGYETVVGERGATLSGGQRQRLTIARAILRDPRILLLDEATSALDSESERVVQEALERLMRGRTTFVVAHRLSTVTGASRIFVIDQGRVVEQGSHEELVARGGLYGKLHSLQVGSDVSRTGV